jgi:dTDP-L-rhamnose 4-epimerase
MRVLITGGAGFVGSHLADLLSAEGHRVRIFDSLEAQVHGDAGGWPPYLPREVERRQGNVCDRTALLAAIEDIDVILHDAAVVGVGQSMYQIRHYTEANLLGTATLLDILANERHKVQKVVVAASMSSYGEGVYTCDTCGTVRPPLRGEEQMRQGDWELHCPKCDGRARPTGTDERADLNSTSVYATTKKVQEELVLMVCKAYGIPAVALRYFNIYGPRQSLSNPYTGVAAIFLGSLKNGQAPLVFEDGLQTRDFVSVHDIARANLLAMLSDKADGETLNVGTGQPMTVARVAEVLADALGVNIPPRIVGRFRKGDVRHCVADSNKIQRLLGWQPEVAFETGIEELIQWSASVDAADHVERATRELSERGLLV